MFDKDSQKDALPLETITRIRSILAESGIFVVEKEWFSDLNAFYSCRVVVRDTEIGTNGKGTTPEAALASAYAEFLERLQNYFLTPRMPHSPALQAEYGFALEPSEICISAAEAPDLPQAFESAVVSADGKTISDLWRRFTRGARQNDNIPFVPFFEMVDSKVEYLPAPFLQGIYGSNGMAAGNTAEEALTQGFAETLERYVQRRLYFEPLRPPEVPQGFLRDYAPKQFATIQAIEMAGPYRVAVRDCALGYDLPVIAIVFVDSNRSGVCVKLGADPDRRIALERCLTELLQGTTLDSLNKLTELHFDEFDHENALPNYRALVQTGQARFPNHFFDATYDQPFVPWQETAFQSSKKRLHSIVEATKRLLPADGRIYVKDRSYLGFPTYQIIAPGVSEAFVKSKRAIEAAFPHLTSRMALTRLSVADDKEVSRLRELLKTALDEQEVAPYSPLSAFFPIPHVNNKTWDKVPMAQLNAMLSMRLGDSAAAAAEMESFISSIKTLFSGIELGYYYCLSRYYEALSSGASREQALAMVSQFFPPETVELVKEDTLNREHTFKHLPLPQCFDCANCEVQTSCRYETAAHLYRAVKRAASKNPITQEELRSVLA